MQIYMKDGKALRTMGYLSPKAMGETWVLNESIKPASDDNIVYTVNFTSNGIAYTKLTWLISTKATLQYDSTTVCRSSPVVWWLDQAYRTITFATTPTGDLLTWLQAHGTKQ